MTDAYQDSAGTTAGAVGQPVGLRLDRRFQAALGAQTIDGSFSSSSNLSGVGAGGWSITNGQLVRDNLQAVTSQVNRNDGASFAPATWYSVRLNVVSVSGGAVQVRSNTGTNILGDITTPGVKSAIFYNVSAVNAQIHGVLAVSCVVDDLDIRPLRGNHFLQASSSLRPILTQEGATFLDLHDSIDDGSATTAFAAGTLTSGMDLFIAVRGFGGADMVIASEDTADATRFIGKLQAGETTSGSACAGVGSAWTAWVNGVQVGGTATTTAAALKTAIGTGSWKILEFRDLDLSAWAKFTWGLYTSFQLDGDLGGRIACAAQADAVRTQVRNLLAQKVGLSL